METRGGRLRRFLLRETGGATGWVNALADSAGVKRQSLSAWMGYRADPDLASIYAIAKALGVRPFQVLAAMDGDGDVAPLTLIEERALQLVDRALDARLGPPRDRRTGAS